MNALKASKPCRIVSAFCDMPPDYPTLTSAATEGAPFPCEGAHCDSGWRAIAFARNRSVSIQKPRRPLGRALALLSLAFSDRRSA